MNGELLAKLEALLFVSGDPMTVRRLAQVLGVGEEEVAAGLEQLQGSYRERGIRLAVKNGKAQFVSAPEHAALVETLVRSQLAEELTPAALETLACVAYREPVTKPEIDDLRGVNSIFSLRALSMRGLVERTGDTYRVTLDFLKKLGIEKVEDLPEYDALRQKTS